MRGMRAGQEGTACRTRHNARSLLRGRQQEKELERRNKCIEEIKEKVIKTELCLTVKEKELREEKEEHKNTVSLLEEVLLEKLKIQEERRKR